MFSLSATAVVRQGIPVALAASAFVASIGIIVYRSISRKSDVIAVQTQPIDRRRRLIHNTTEFLRALKRNDLVGAYFCVLDGAPDPNMIKTSVDNPMILWSRLTVPRPTTNRKLQLYSVFDALLHNGGQSFLNVPTIGVGRPIDVCTIDTGRILIANGPAVGLDVLPADGRSPLIRLIRIRSDRRTIRECIQMIAAVDPILLDWIDDVTGRTALYEACAAFRLHTGNANRNEIIGLFAVINDLATFGFPFVGPDRSCFRYKPTINDARTPTEFILQCMLDQIRTKIDLERNRWHKKLTKTFPLIIPLLDLTLSYVF